MERRGPHQLRPEEQTTVRGAAWAMWFLPVPFDSPQHLPLCEEINGIMISGLWDPTFWFLRSTRENSSWKRVLLRARLWLGCGGPQGGGAQYHAQDST